MSKMKKKKNPDNKVGFGRLVLWETSAVSVAIYTLTIGFATFYCTDILGLEPVLVGTMFMLSKLIDSVTDFVAGLIIDKTQTKWGKGRPYEIFMLFLWVCTFGLFSCPEGFSTIMKYVWIFFMYVFANAVCQTFLNGNNVVYMVRAFKTREQHAKVIAYGGFFQMAGGFAFNIGFPIAMSKIAVDASGWSRLIGMIAVPMTFLGVIRMLTIKEQYNNEADSAQQDLKLRDVVTLFTTNHSAVLLCVARLLHSTIVSMGVGIYYFQYIVQDVSLMSLAAVFSVLGLPLAFVMPAMRKKWGLDNTVIIGFLVILGGSVIMFFAGANVTLVLIAGLMSNIGAVPFTMMSNMYVVDCADYNEMIGNPRMEGTMGSVFGLVSKIGSAFGGFVLGAFLSLAGYDGELAVQSDAALFMIRALSSIVPFLFYVVIIFTMKKVKLDDKLKDFRKNLEEKNQNASVAEQA